MGAAAGALTDTEWQVAYLAGYAGTDFIGSLYKIKIQKLKNMTAILKFTSTEFDPIAFLKLNHIEDSKKKQLKPRLLNNISEYLLIRLLDILPKEIDKEVNFDQISSISKLEDIFRQYIPHLDAKIDDILAEFKKEYKNRYKDYYE